MNPDNPSHTPTSPSATKPPLKQRLQALMTEYGRVAVVLYFGIFFLVLGGFAAAFALGWKRVDADGGPQAAGMAWVFVAAYGATKVTQPLRIAATLVLTPAVARLLTRFSRSPRAPREPS